MIKRHQSYFRSGVGPVILPELSRERYLNILMLSFRNLFGTVDSDPTDGLIRFSG